MLSSPVHRCLSVEWRHKCRNASILDLVVQSQTYSLAGQVLLWVVPVLAPLVELGAKLSGWHATSSADQGRQARVNCKTAVESIQT